MLQTLVKNRGINKPVIVPVPYYEQETEFTCGPASLKMLLHYHGQYCSERRIRKHTKTKSEGTNHEQLIDGSRLLGMHCFVKQNAETKHIKSFINRGFPVMINWQEPKTNDSHYSVIFGYYKNYFYLHDPYYPRRKVIHAKKLLPLWRDGGQFKWLMVASKEKINTCIKGKTYLPL